MGIIILIVAILGLILLIIGVIAAGMVMFGYNKVKVGGRNKLQVKIRGMEIAVDTGRVYFAIVLGLVLVMGPFTLAEAKLLGPVVKAASVEKATPTTSKLEGGGYTISEEEIRVDLRNRKEIRLKDYFAGDLSKTIRLVRIVLKNVPRGVEEVDVHGHSTSGYSIEAIEKPEGAKWLKLERESKGVLYHPFFDLIRREKSFADIVKRKGKMKTYYMIVPISDGECQEIQYKLEYNNAFQGSDFEWAGKTLCADTDILTMHITFPEIKPYKSFEAYKKETPAAPNVLISDPDIETAPDHSRLTWNIQNAKKGESYYIKWKW